MEPIDALGASDVSCLAIDRFYADDCRAVSRPLFDQYYTSCGVGISNGKWVRCVRD